MMDVQRPARNFDGDTWANKKATYEQNIMSYSGPDPLKPRYDYVVWLEKKMVEGEGDAAEGALMPVLENTLALYKEDRRYTQDPRFAQLLVLYVERQSQPLEVYETVYSQGGVGTRCSVLYVSWANLAEGMGDLFMAYEVYEKGLSADAQPSQILAQAQRQFLVRVGTQYLKGDIKNDQSSQKSTKEQLCSRCKGIVGGLSDKAESNGFEGCSVKSWELRSLRVGDLDDFTCPLAYFEPIDPKKKCMYPKSRVYIGDKEYQLEELIAEERGYGKKIPSKSANDDVCATTALSGKEEVPSDKYVVERVSDGDMNKDQNKNYNKAPAQVRLQPPIIQQPTHQLLPQLPPFSKAFQETEQNSLWGQSMTINMKAAMNEVQDMWNSPAPSTARKLKPDIEPPASPSDGAIFKLPHQEASVAAGIVKEDIPQSKKKLPFEVFAEPSTLNEDDVVSPASLLLEVAPPVPVSVTKHPPTQFTIYSDENVLQSSTKTSNVKCASTVKKVNPTSKSERCQSEKKPFQQQQMLMDDELHNGEGSGGGARQLIFLNEKEPMAKKIEENNVQPPQKQQIQPGISPNEKDWKDKQDEDMTDVTCNTRAFAFALPSSTPFQNQAAKSRAIARGLATYDANGSYMVTAPEPDNLGHVKTNTIQQKLGVPQQQQHEVPQQLPQLVIPQQQQHPQQPVLPPSGGMVLRHPHELSMILEASNSSSGAGGGTTGSGSSTVKTPSSQLTFNKTPGTGCSAVKNLEDNVRNLLLDDAGEVNPFSSKLINSLLAKIKFPQAHGLNNYHCFNSTLPYLNKTVKIGNETFNIQGEIGKGNYARVVKASCGTKTIALKVEKPACIWEYYICEEIKRRVPAEKVGLFMNIRAAFIFQNGSLLETEWAKYGSLLNVVNQIKVLTGKPIDILVSSYLTVQIVDAVDYLHRCNIIHGDIKPDNFVLRDVPTTERLSQPYIQLIDFGRSIDMKLLPPGTTFTVLVNTDGFQCNEMKEKQPWTYQTDLYGLAGTVYCLLVGEYMKVTKKKSVWHLQKILPRYFNRDIWDPFFHSLLNVESCTALPNLSVLKAPIEKNVMSTSTFRLTQTFQTLANKLDNK